MSELNELLAQLNAIEESITEARQRVHEMNITRRDLIREIHCRVHGVKVGSVVNIVSHRPHGKLKTGEPLLVAEVDDRYLRTTQQPVIRVQYKVKGGGWSKDTVSVYGQWKVVESEGSK